MNWTMNLWPQTLYGATYLAQAAVAMLSGAILVGVRLPLPIYAGSSGGRPISQIVRYQPFLAAVVCGSISYMLIFSDDSRATGDASRRSCAQSANIGLQWHVVAMYAPSFFTGNLIARFGARTIAVPGLLSTMLSTCIGLAGVDVLHFYGLLVLLGVGWNFGFVGASALVLECPRPEEKTRVQSLNDFVVFGVMAVGSFSSGGILSVYGWTAVLWVSLIPLFLATVILVFYCAALLY